MPKETITVNVNKNHVKWIPRNKNFVVNKKTRSLGFHARVTVDSDIPYHLKFAADIEKKRLTDKGYYIARGTSIKNPQTGKNEFIIYLGRK